MLSYHSSSTVFKNASVDAILNYLENLDSACSLSAHVKRLSRDVVLKRRLSSTEREYQNLRAVWELCDQKVLRIPEPIRWFQGRDKSGVLYGYLLMEYLPGRTIEEELKTAEPDALDAIVRKVFSAIRHLQIESWNIHPTPGPPYGGLASGFPWGEYGANVQFDSLQDLEKCLEQRLRRWNNVTTRTPDIGKDLVFCHLDLMPRNIIITDDGVVGIVDWETLAVYPTIFELAGLSFAKNVVGPEECCFLDGLMKYLKRIHTSGGSA